MLELEAAGRTGGTAVEVAVACRVGRLRRSRYAVRPEQLGLRRDAASDEVLDDRRDLRGRGRAREHPVDAELAQGALPFLVTRGGDTEHGDAQPREPVDDVALEVRQVR